MTRSDRILAFQEYIKNYEGDCFEKQLLRRYSLESGIAIRTIAEYLTLLVEAGLVERTHVPRYQNTYYITWNE